MTTFSGAWNAVPLDLECYASSDFPRRTFQIVDGSNVGHDMTGWNLRFVVRDVDDAGGSPRINIVSSASSGDRPVWIDQTAGAFYLDIDKATLAALPRNTAQTNEMSMFRYEVRAENGSQDVLIMYRDLAVKGIV